MGGHPRRTGESLNANSSTGSGTTSYALTGITDEVERAVAELVRRAVG
ncbi:hypothetical protein [Cellulomonas dongxiuzhuiae]|nr:hypothetical protein [Cellulomonas dongxiuzhuiae]MBO3096003.1 hypothetical protein [Cellulomonas dongxiuzhuiae]